MATFMLRSLGFLVFGSEGPGAWWAFAFRCLLVRKTIDGRACLGRCCLASAVRCTLERGLEPATKPEGTLAFGDESTDNASVLEGGAGAALALRLGVQRKNTQRWWVPRDWLRRCRSLLVELCPALAKALGCEEDTDEGENINSEGHRTVHARGLSDILSTGSVTLCVGPVRSPSFDLVIPYAAACILALLDEPLQFFLRDNDDPQVHEAFIRLGKDLPLTDVETCFRRVVPKIAPDARVLAPSHGRHLVEASLPGAAGCSSRRRCRARAAVSGFVGLADVVVVDGEPVDPGRAGRWRLKHVAEDAHAVTSRDDGV